MMTDTDLRDLEAKVDEISSKHELNAMTEIRQLIHKDIVTILYSALGDDKPDRAKRIASEQLFEALRLNPFLSYYEDDLYVDEIKIMFFLAGMRFANHGRLDFGFDKGKPK